MKSNRILQKTVLNAHRGVRLGYFHQQGGYVCDTTRFDRFLCKMIQQSSKSATKIDISYFRDF